MLGRTVVRTLIITVWIIWLIVVIALQLNYKSLLAGLEVTGSVPLQRVLGMFTAKEVIQFVISGVLMVASLFVILSKRYGSQEKNWAFGTLGVIMGLWLKS
jgi:hypothetical protein